MNYHQSRYDEPLIFEIEEGEPIKVPNYPIKDNMIPKNLKRKGLDIPTLSEESVVRHYTRLSQMNYGIDTGFYPLGSCTMKYNRKVMEEIARLGKVTNAHPYQDDATVQGSLEIMYELQRMLCEIGGVDAVTLQPAAGAQGEFTGLLITRAYHELNGEERNEVILPDSSHGTNPASAVMAGYDVVEIPSKAGCVDLEALSSAVSKDTAVLMLTNPNLLGIFEKDVVRISKILHDHGALLYYDGANLNAIMGITTPGKMDFDIVHFNLHKTFGTPHGGGGPGSGPLGVKKHLEEFLPVPSVEYNGSKYHLDYDRSHSIGKIKGFYGNFNVLVKAYVYIKLMGSDGLKEVTERAVLNTNYLKARLEKHFDIPFKNHRKHEFVVDGSKLKERGFRTLDLSKRLLDYGFHAPTIYFPHLVEEAMMIEPTETESKETLDEFVDAMINILNEDVELVKNAPYNTSVRRVNEVEAARKLILSMRMYEK